VEQASFLPGRTETRTKPRVAPRRGDPLVGVDQVQASAVVNGVQIYSNVVSVEWNNGTNQAPVVSAGQSQTIMLPEQAILSGTVTDDGLPNNTLTTTWSVVSGPGPVTFDDANQPATAATFNVPGTYVLQLSAFDGALTTNATVTITVNANNNLTTGWILSPVNNAAVSGQVPITLVSGISLVSGTLTYFPATAVGDYKPGRVTATITDLTVDLPGAASGWMCRKRKLGQCLGNKSKRAGDEVQVVQFARGAVKAHIQSVDLIRKPAG
jgi:hypothetical protein